MADSVLGTIFFFFAVSVAWTMGLKRMAKCSDNHRVPARHVLVGMAERLLTVGDDLR